MEYFLQTTHLDSATAEMLQKYDKDGNGSFSKDEVVAIILDLREAMSSNERLGQSNKFFKRLLIAAFFFCVLLLTSMFGLSYAVAALTANTDVNNGVMYTRDGNEVIATDSTASHFSVGANSQGVYCLDGQEAWDLQTKALSGRNVLLEWGDSNSIHIEQIQANGATIEDGKTCFYAQDLKRSICIVEMEDGCEPVDAGGRRKLESRQLNTCSKGNCGSSKGIVFSDE